MVTPELQTLGQDVEGLEPRHQLVQQRLRMHQINLVLDSDVRPEAGLILARQPGREGQRQLGSQSVEPPSLEPIGDAASQTSWCAHAEDQGASAGAGGP